MAEFVDTPTAMAEVAALLLLARYSALWALMVPCVAAPIAAPTLGRWGIVLALGHFPDTQGSEGVGVSFGSRDNRDNIIVCCRGRN